MQYFTQYSSLYPDLSVQSLVNIWADPSNMIEQVESYNKVVVDSGVAPLSFREGQFLYFALQGHVPLHFLQIEPDVAS